MDYTKHSVIMELFRSISYFDEKTNNDRVITKIKETVKNIFGIYSKEKQNKEKKLNMINKYKNYLLGLEVIVKQQSELLEALKSKLEVDETIDMSDTILGMGDEIQNYCMQQNEIKLYELSNCFTNEELNIISDIQIYDLMNGYINCIKRYIYYISEQNCDQYIKEIEGKEFILKKHYFVYLDSEKNKKIKKDIFSIKNVMESNKEIAKFENAFYQAQLAKCIYERRNRKQMTQAQLAEVSGVNRSMIAKIEKIQQPASLETTIKLLTALDMELKIFPTDKIYTHW